MLSAKPKRKNSKHWVVTTNPADILTALERGEKRKPKSWWVRASDWVMKTRS